MLTLALSLLVTQTPQHRLFLQPNLPRSTYAFFEAFPASGAGTTTACSTTAPTGVQGEALTFTRASAGTCTKGTNGLRSTLINDGDLVVLSTNVARVEYDSAGYLGLLVEAARTNVLLRNAALTNAAWADVGTPTVSNSETDPFGTSLANTVEDDDGAAYEGRSQAVTVSAGAAYFMHCYVKAGTLDQATISIDGTTQAITGLSTTTWSIVEKADASSSGVSIPIQVLVGDAVGDTGSVIFGGCQVEAGAYRTSIVPTTSAAVTRAADVSAFTISFSTAAGFSLATSSVSPQANGGATWGIAASLYADVTNRTQLYRANTNGLTADYLSTAGNRSNAAPPTVGPYVALTQYRTAASMTAPGASSVLSNWFDAVLVENSAAGTTGAFTATSLFLGNLTSGSAADTLIISRVCLDPDPARCR